MHCLGRAEYGRLGIGENVTEKDSPQLVGTLADKKTVNVSCGTATSFAVLDSGEVLLLLILFQYKHEFHETCHSVTFYFMKKRLQTML